MRRNSQSPSNVLTDPPPAKRTETRTMILLSAPAHVVPTVRFQPEPPPELLMVRVVPSLNWSWISGSGPELVLVSKATVSFAPAGTGACAW